VPADDLLLLRLDHKLQLVRDRIQGVAEGYATGLYLWGEGGKSKSFTTEQGRLPLQCGAEGPRTGRGPADRHAAPAGEGGRVEKTNGKKPGGSLPPHG
jgi:hypothetical protein